MLADQVLDQIRRRDITVWYVLMLVSKLYTEGGWLAITHGDPDAAIAFEPIHIITIPMKSLRYRLHSFALGAEVPKLHRVRTYMCRVLVAAQRRNCQREYTSGSGADSLEAKACSLVYLLSDKLCPCLGRLGRISCCVPRRKSDLDIEVACLL